MQKDILNKLHTGHQGLTKCREKRSGRWLGLSGLLQETVEKCQNCSQYRLQPPQPLIPGETPHGPWQKVGADLFQLDDSMYLVMFDYFSRFIEVAKLLSTTSTVVMERIKSWFARNGIPLQVITDTGPQLSSDTLRQFAKAWGFTRYCYAQHF